ncbi:phage tail tube protein [uncultured Tissierella sp.]|jgi:hypothetical protein|uniref:phage tail tube protein n=1 Tax=uncultured Tissierella sp. TaxID=448160 RepID=UPI002803B966|nr:phage tail tube protein [uncultured Tissierella sp.]MDU5082806.1 phage tail tube protein [Bacillota bacterium]
MANKVPGYRQIAGSWGQIWWDGELVFEVESFEAKITAEREDVYQAGSLDTDSKMTGLKGEGSFKVKHVFSRGVLKLLKAWKEGRDVRSQLIGKLGDPDAYGSERCVINNVWFNELTLMQFEMKQKLEREFPFGFTPSDVDFPDRIEVK